MKELTSYDLKEISGVVAWAEPTEEGRRLGLTQGFGIRQPIRPLLAARDVRPEEVLAAYPDGSAAVVLRRLPDGPSLFVGVPNISSELLRLAAKEAGVHLVTQEDAVIYRNHPFIVIHPVNDGQLTVHPGNNVPVWDYLTGESLGNGPTLSLEVKAGHTRVLVCGEKITADMAR